PTTLENLKRTRRVFGRDFEIIATGGVDSADKAVALLDEGATAVGYFTGFVTRGPILARLILERRVRGRCARLRGAQNAHTLSTCPPLSTIDKIAPSGAGSRGRPQNMPVHSSTESTPLQNPGFHAGATRGARVARAFFAHKRGLDTE